MWAIRIAPFLVCTTDPSNELRAKGLRVLPEGAAPPAA
ncbi:MAG: hypothetical protein BLITH_0514 [Brockia lithotrophica]|uniref:Uncharacterized protein n=1 Tax=Brockia lithotrophica TaxID=933949 RepID=A0A2T5G4H7_9BACL|nr:MAG: hypothetical protein BLITH_0514 [Brockia lithotrophica]